MGGDNGIVVRAAEVAQCGIFLDRNNIFGQ